MSVTLDLRGINNSIDDLMRLGQILNNFFIGFLSYANKVYRKRIVQNQLIMFDFY